MPKGNRLIVDDNKSVLSALEIMLTPEFDRVQCLSNPNLIVTELRRKPYHLVLLDMNFKAGVNTGNARSARAGVEPLAHDHPSEK